MNDERRRLLDEVVAPYRAGRISRRQALGLLGALGLTAFGDSAGGRRAMAAGPHETHDPAARFQEGKPVLGPRPGGTSVWGVRVGGMDMATGIDLHAFFPGEITINAGDTIFFEFAPMGVPGFHTVTFTSSEAVPPLLTPDLVEGTPVPSPEGLPRLLINPALALPVGGDRYNGTGYVNSGIDVFRADQGPYTLTFTEAGTYDYACAIHGVVMKGKVTVQEAGAAPPNDLAAYEAMAADQMARLIEEGKATIARYRQALGTPSASGTTWEVAVGAGGLSQARVMRFFPPELTIQAGDTVRWVNRTIGEPHTVTFLGGEDQPEDVLIEPQAGGPPKFVQNYQTLLPAGGPSFDGIGYHNSGFMGEILPGGDRFPGLDPYELTFTAPGEYRYYCVFHASGPEAEDGMVGRIVVEA